MDRRGRAAAGCRSGGRCAREEVGDLTVLAHVGPPLTAHATGAHGDATPWLLPAVVVVALGGAYLAAAARLGTRTGRRWAAGRCAAFGIGTVLLAVAVSPLVDGLADGAARAHMVQHVLLGMAAPVALVLGAPVTLVLASLPVRRRRVATAVLRSRPVRVLTHPVTAATLHVGGLAALYCTPLYARTLTDPWAHGAVLVHFVLAGCLYAWSLVGPERAARGPGLAWRVGVLVVASGVHGYLAKLLHARAGSLPPGSPHTAAEMQDAARWMYYAGDVAEVALAVALFSVWYRRRAARGPVRTARPAVTGPPQPAA